MGTKKDKIYKILVVDDEPGIRELLFDILNFLGFQSIVAANGVEALETLARDKVDLIISDIRMPQMNGIELLKAAKKQNPKIPFILVSGYKLNDVDKAFADEMANGFLAKPFEIDQIKNIIFNLLPN
jgi:CheY-like chemotaxis protein